MSRHFVQLTQANLPVFQGPILNPNGEKVIEISTLADPGYYAGLLAPAQEIGDIVLVKFDFSSDAPLGQVIKIAGRFGITTSGAPLFKSETQNLAGLQTARVLPPTERSASIALQYLGQDWLILAKTTGVVPLEF